MGKNIVITPYMCQIIYLEMRRFERGELTPQELILRMDLIHLQNFSNISDYELGKEIITSTALHEIVELDKKLRETPYEMLSYLEGNGGGINKTNKLLVSNGYNTMDLILNQNNIVDSPIIVYIFYTLSGRMKDRDKMDKGIMKDYILKNSKKSTSPVVEDFFKKINSEILDIKQILSSQKKVETELNIDFILNNLMTIKSQIQNLNPEIEIKGLDTLDAIKEELKSIMESTKEQKNIVIELESLQGTNETNLKNYINYIKGTIDKNCNDLDNLVKRQESTRELLDNSKEGIENSLLDFQDFLIDLNSKIRDINFEEISNLVKTMTNIQKSSVIEVNKHNQLLGETSESIHYVVNNMNNIKEVLMALNDLISEDSIQKLNKGKEDLSTITEELDDFSKKYLKMRGEYN